MRKDICQQCHSKYGMGWEFGDEGAWKDGVVLCVGDHFTAHSIERHAVFPPAKCLYALEHLVLEQAGEGKKS